MLIKRKDSPYWYIKFEIDGRKIYRSTGTEDKEQAQAVAVRLYSEMFVQVKLGQKQRYLWQNAVIRWLNESENRSIETEKCHLRWLSGHLDNLYLDEIDQNVIERIISAKLQNAGTTRVNRTTGIVSSILNKARKKWGWIDTVPHIRKFKESQKRIRWLTMEEAARLLEELQPHARAMCVFTLATGLRESNVTGLEWNQIDMQNRIAWIHADQSKNEKTIRIPMNDDAVAILRQQIGKHHTRVFTFKGRPIEKVGTKSFRAALKRAGIENFRWHDLRHTWASWHIQAGTPLHVLQELGGWSDYKMVLRYAHLAPEHLAEHANRLAVITESLHSDNVTRLKYR